ncbi:hypothetical protein PMIN06_013153 [Paraphaeosphaeria minitans]
MAFFSHPSSILSSHLFLDEKRTQRPLVSTPVVCPHCSACHEASALGGTDRQSQGSHWDACLERRVSVCLERCIGETRSVCLFWKLHRPKQSACVCLETACWLRPILEDVSDKNESPVDNLCARQLSKASSNSPLCRVPERLPTGQHLAMARRWGRILQTNSLGLPSHHHERSRPSVWQSPEGGAAWRA